MDGSAPPGSNPEPLSVHCRPNLNISVSTAVRPDGSQRIPGSATGHDYEQASPAVTACDSVSTRDGSTGTSCSAAPPLLAAVGTCLCTGCCVAGAGVWGSSQDPPATSRARLLGSRLTAWWVPIACSTTRHCGGPPEGDAQPTVRTLAQAPQGPGAGANSADPRETCPAWVRLTRCLVVGTVLIAQ